MKKIFTLVTSLCSFYLGSHAQSHALLFDGINDVARYPDNSAYHFSTGDFTVEAWIKTTSAGLQVAAGAGNGANYFLGSNSGQARFAINGQALDGSASQLVNDGQWHHLAGVRSAGLAYLYVDGILQPNSGSSNTGTTDGSGDFVIGNFNNGFFWNGAIDEVRVWNIPRTQQQIKLAMFGKDAGTAGLVAYFRLNEGSGQTLSDASATGASGTTGSSAAVETNDPTWTTSPVQFALNGLAFDGVNDQVNIGTGFNHQRFTIEMWVKPGATQNPFADIIDNNHSTGISWVLQQNGGTHNEYIFGSNGSASQTFTLTANTWQHIAIVIGSGTRTVYVNGTVVSNETGLAGINYNGNEFIRLGNWGGGGRNWNGVMDEVRIWTAARTQTEIQNFMSTEISGSQPELLVSYNFNAGVPEGNNTGLSVLPNLVGSDNYNGTLNGFDLTGITSNFIAGAPGITPLPLSLTSFTASRQTNTVQVDWNTVNEQNIVSFDVERSVNGRNFASLGSVKAAGNSAAANSYSFTDAKPQSAVNYYRLKTVEGSGKVLYSQVVIVKMSSSTKLDVYPNPVQDVMQLQITATGKINISIYNAAGLLVKKILTPATSGTTTMPIDVRAFSKGLYILQLETASGLEKVNFVKQ